MKNPIPTIQRFWSETLLELRKCTWPSQHELVESTMVVIASLIMLSAFVALVDWLSQWFIRLITLI